MKAKLLWQGRCTDVCRDMIKVRVWQVGPRKLYVEEWVPRSPEWKEFGWCETEDPDLYTEAVEKTLLKLLQARL